LGGRDSNRRDLGPTDTSGRDTPKRSASSTISSTTSMSKTSSTMSSTATKTSSRTQVNPPTGSPDFVTPAPSHEENPRPSSATYSHLAGQNLALLLVSGLVALFLVL
jgi:hypothetical protein